MRVIRFLNEQGSPTFAALTGEDKVYILPQTGLPELVKEAEDRGTTALSIIQEVMIDSLPIEKTASELDLLVPIVAPEIWACGVTYERSKEARNYEATGGKTDTLTFYDKVYDAVRPEIFLKSTAARTIGPNEDVYLRSDSNWQIPEPELSLVLTKDGSVIGYTIGNDMSCRDIEGENPLYLPQAKIWKNSCVIGPAILLAEAVEDPYTFQIICRIYRENELVFEGSATTGQLKRKFDELIDFLIFDNEAFDGTVLMTGTCIVPPNEFTLQNGDYIEMEIPGIGVLRNPVKSQVKNAVAERL